MTSLEFWVLLDGRFEGDYLTLKVLAFLGHQEELPKSDAVGVFLERHFEHFKHAVKVSPIREQAAQGMKTLSIARPEREGLTVGALGFLIHLAVFVEISCRCPQLGERSVGIKVVHIVRVSAELVNVARPKVKSCSTTALGISVRGSLVIL